MHMICGMVAPDSMRWFMPPILYAWVPMPSGLIFASRLRRAAACCSELVVIALTDVGLTRKMIEWCLEATCRTGESPWSRNI